MSSNVTWSCAGSGTAEIAQQLRAPVALVEDLGSVPSTHMMAHCWDQTASSDLQQQACAWCSSHMQAKHAFMHIKNECEITTAIYMNLLSCLFTTVVDVGFLNTHVLKLSCDFRWGCHPWPYLETPLAVTVGEGMHWRAALTSSPAG